MNPIASVSRRFLPRGTVLALTLVLLGPSGSVHAQAPDLQPVEVVGGLSLHDAFYDDLRDEVSGDLSSRTGFFPGGEFVPYMESAKAEVEQFNGALLVAFEATLAVLIFYFPVLGTVATTLLNTLLALFCGGLEPGGAIKLPLERTFGICTLSADPIDWSQLANGTGHEVMIDAHEVGVVGQIVVSVWLGDPEGTCSSSDKKDLRFVFRDFQYRATVTFTANGPQVQVTPVGALPEVSKMLDGSEGSTTAETLWNSANQQIGGVDLEQKLIEFAGVTVAQTLRNAIIQYWTPYLPHNDNGAVPNWLMNLDGLRQNERLTDNLVPGSVGPVSYDLLVADVANAKTRARLRNTHSGILSDDDPACADGSAFVPAHASLAPNFAVEAAAVDGAYHTSFKNFEHVVVGGIRSNVGLRADYKTGSPYVVEYPFSRLVPECGSETISFLLSDPSSSLTNPNAAGSVPISTAHRNALFAKPIAAFGTLGNTPLSELSLKISVCEERKSVLPAPLSSLTSGEGTVSHDVLMQVAVEHQGVPVLTEYMDATFMGDLLLSKTPGEDATELRTIRSYLAGLQSLGNGVDWTGVTNSISFNSAPVSLFLRALFGDHETHISSPDQRAFYLIEGLTGGLVERSAHGMAVLPGLDVSAYVGPQLAFLPEAVAFYGDDYLMGFQFDRPALCASIVRWGEAPGLVNGTPSTLLRNRTLVIEVDWEDSFPMTQFERKIMSTVVTGSAVPTTDDLADSNPSRYDTGFLLTEYSPSVGDESRVCDMSGNRFGAYLPGGGRHWVAATPAGYSLLRDMYFADPASFSDTTFELRPYAKLGSAAACDLLYPQGPLVATAGGNGYHHEDAPEGIFEALTFETRLSCKGDGDCDGTRLVARWTAPLFAECGDDSFGQDRATFVLDEGTLRVPPTSYEFEVLNCIGGGGGGGGSGSGGSGGGPGGVGSHSGPGHGGN